MKFPERFHTFMPESGKKADLMFVQHMVASLKSDGKMAVVMPHGVLFRGGEEKECRKKFIKEGILEAVVGLPPGLFYGTGIPACVLVINKDGASKRKSVLFINADREYNLLSAHLAVIFSEFPGRGKSVAVVVRRQAEQVEEAALDAGQVGNQNLGGAFAML